MPFINHKSSLTERRITFKKHLMCIPIACLIALHSVTIAQDTPPFPPDPSQLFTSNVMVVDTIIEEPVANSFPRFDNGKRVVRIYDQTSQSWLEFPYPQEVKKFEDGARYQDDIFLLSTEVNWGLSGEETIPSKQWFLDIETGEFSRPELLCDEIRNKSGEGRWIFPRESTDPKTPELCNTETGKRISIKVDGWINLDNDVSVSPDQTRVIIFGVSDIYVYNFVDNTILTLGETKAHDIQRAQWLGNQYVIIYETQWAEMGFPWQYYSLADVTKANSLEFITTVLKYESEGGNIGTLNNPKRVEWIKQDEATQACYLIQIRVDSGERTEYPLGDLCDLGIVLGDTDDRLFTVTHSRPTSNERWQLTDRDLVRFNPYTGERTDLFHGEVEYIMDISHDGSYAVIILDDNGQIDMVKLDDTPPLDFRDKPTHYHLTIIDLETGEILYTKPMSAVPSCSTYCDLQYITLDESTGEMLTVYERDMRMSPAASMFSIGKGRFILTEDEKNTLIDVQQSPLREIAIDRPYLVSLDNNYLITVPNKDKIEGVLSVYNAITHQSIPIMSSVKVNEYPNYLEVQGYSLSLTWGDAPDLLNVRLYTGSYQPSVTYVVRLPS